MNPNSSRPVVICACGLLTAFFMPWFQLFGLGVSGYNLGQLGSYGNYAWIIPILAGAIILLSFGGVNNRPLGAITGIVPLGALIYGLLRLSSEGGADATKGVFEIAPHILSIGAYLTIIFCIALIIAASAQPGTTAMSAVKLDAKSQAAGHKADVREALLACYCEQCGTRADPGSKFCEECGDPLG